MSVPNSATKVQKFPESIEMWNKSCIFAAEKQGMK